MVGIDGSLVHDCSKSQTRNSRGLVTKGGGAVLIIEHPFETLVGCYSESLSMKRFGNEYTRWYVKSLDGVLASELDGHRH